MFKNIIFSPAYRPSSGLRTPLVLVTAHLENEPAPGYAWKNELPILHKPVASNSCVASTGLPLAKVNIT